MHAKDGDGRTQLHHAAWLFNVSTVELLVTEFGVGIDPTDIKGYTPLHIVSYAIRFLEVDEPKYSSAAEYARLKPQNALHDDLIFAQRESMVSKHCPRKVHVLVYVQKSRIKLFEMYAPVLPFATALGVGSGYNQRLGF